MIVVARRAVGVHPVELVLVRVAKRTWRGFFEKVLQEEDELREPLHRLDHEAEEGDSVVGGDLLHLEEVSQGTLTFGLLKADACESVVKFVRYITLVVNAPDSSLASSSPALRTPWPGRSC